MTRIRPLHETPFGRFGLLPWNRTRVFEGNAPLPLPGVYVLLNLSNSKMYVGSAMNIEVRVPKHFRKNPKHSARMKRAFAEFGPGVFVVIPILYLTDKTDTEFLIQAERATILSLNTTIDGYNTLEDFPSLETTSAGVKASWQKPERREAQRISGSRPEVWGVMHTPEAMQKRIAAFNTPEMKQKRSEVFQRPELREKLNAAIRNPEVQARKSISQKAAFAKPEYKAALSARMTAYWERHHLREQEEWYKEHLRKMCLPPEES